MIFYKGKKILEMVDNHYETVMNCYTHFAQFMDEYFKNGDTALARELWSKIDAEEAKADDLRRAVVNEFLNGGMLAQTRSEILKLIKLVDGVANKCEDLSTQILYEKVEFKEEIKDGLCDILRITNLQLDSLSEAIEALFSNYEPLLKDSALLEAVKHNEELVDEKELEVIKCIFDSEYDLAEKNQQRYFTSKIADISDLIENIADEVQIMVVFRKI